MTYVQLSELCYAYERGAGDVLHRFTLHMEEGEVVGLLGESGSGKSTVLRLIAGLETPREGSIVVGNTVMVDRTTFVQPERRGIGMVFQDYALFPHMTVESNIAFGLGSLPRGERRDRIGEMLELVKMADYRKRYPHELSGGQQQRIAFARALAPRPRLLLMDEPFSSLDAGLKASIREELRELLRLSRMTSILVTHDREDADALCDRIVEMRAPALSMA
ncbi:ABC transporter ATP-binding protein [Paenibacillus sp. J5C_2022]|uniref:ABC transporter ATP-binding protein n=1 Tax=Paenibacillus sp. J5C2022 TaxID=2977129 RepID=UPI0021D0A548|nr:ABC transporter ATP-binding protein [Paenibacillus sp. J5C2022]MCU6710885.1 ABC transporter ATP-binding protein [Paenibacillus sp. J5C2022]